MTRLLAALPFALAALATGGPAAAQVAGTYQGQAADGSPVSFTVSSVGGGLAVTGASVDYTATCNRGAPNLSTGWGYGPSGADISNRKVQNTTVDPFFVISFKMTFSTDGQSAVGNISAISPSLQPPGSPTPTSAAFCKSRNQSMAVTLQSPSKVKPPAAGPVMLGRSQSFPTYQP